VTVAELLDAVEALPPPQPSRVPRVARRRRLEVAAAVALDAALILIGFALAYWMRYSVRWPPPFELVIREVASGNYVPIEAFTPYALGLLLLLLALYAMKGLYRMPRSASILDHAGIILSSTTIGIAVLIVVVFLHRSSAFYSRLIFGFAWVAITMLLIAWRTALIWARRWRWAHGIGREPVLVVGGKGLGRSVMEGIVAHPFLGYHLVGYLEDGEQPAPAVTPPRHFHHLGQVCELERILRGGEIEHVLLALPFWEQHRLPELVDTCRAAGVDFRVAPDLYHLSFDRVQVDQLSGIPLIGLKTLSLKGWNLLLKRALDIVLVLISLPVSALLALTITVAIKIDSPGPVVFKQTRVGRHGRRFTAYKFRTMVADAEARKAELAANGEIDARLFKVRDDPRTTRVGRLLRRLSLDELPQFWNVLLGEMSLVGPRPQVPEEVEQYEDWHHRRLEVLPGITGLWQVLGRSDTSFDEMVRLDIYYAENWSLDMDLRIMIQTLPAMLSGRGAY
jgi:exopolysaccharide biosynthesis polyprenyl glycosylphosphotransferase